MQPASIADMQEQDDSSRGCRGEKAKMARPDEIAEMKRILEGLMQLHAEHGRLLEQAGRRLHRLGHGQEPEGAAETGDMTESDN